MFTPQMLLLLLLLLLLRGLASAAPASLQQDYGSPADPETVPPSIATSFTTTTQSITLALPFLLTLNSTNLHTLTQARMGCPLKTTDLPNSPVRQQTPTQDERENPFHTPDLPDLLVPQHTVTQTPTGWLMSLEVLDEAAVKLAQVDLNSEDDEVTLTGCVNELRSKSSSIPLDGQRESHHLHLAVTVQERQLRFIHVADTRNTTVMDLDFPIALPSRIRVTSATVYSYSALTTTTTTTATVTVADTTTATTSTTPHISKDMWTCVVVAVAATLVFTTGLVLVKCCPHGLPTTTTAIPNKAWACPQTSLSRHDSVNSLYGVMELPLNPRPAAPPRSYYLAQ